MVEEKLKDGWVRIKQSDSKMNDLPCLKDNKDNVIKVFGWDGTELVHNAEARSVFYNGQFWYY